MNAEGKVNVSSYLWAQPGTLYNQVIAPLVGTGLRGVMWYQGEANMNEGYHLSRQNYYCLFQTMISAWRREWGDAFMPFTFVQLHSCDVGNTGQCFPTFCNYGDIRLAQDDTDRFLPATGMAVAYDKGHKGIHSPYKAEVARRLGMKVLSTAFHLDNVAEDGPLLAGACVLTPPQVSGASNKTQVLLRLDNTAGLAMLGTSECAQQSPLCCNGTTPGLPGVALGMAQIDVGDVWKGQQWYDATIQLVDSNGTPSSGPPEALLLTADLGSNTHSWGQEDSPVWQVRYAVGAFPSCAVVNSNGIPLRPFGPLAVSPACSLPW